MLTTIYELPQLQLIVICNNNTHSNTSVHIISFLMLANFWFVYPNYSLTSYRLWTSEVVGLFSYSQLMIWIWALLKKFFFFPHESICLPSFGIQQWRGDGNQDKMGRDDTKGYKGCCNHLVTRPLAFQSAAELWQLIENLNIYKSPVTPENGEKFTYHWPS